MSAPLNHVNPSKHVSLNDRIAIFWPIEKQFFPGIVTNPNHDGRVVVHYEDDDVETLDLAGEVWKFLPPSEPVPLMNKPVALPLSATAPDADPVPTSTTTEPPVQKNQGQVQLQPSVNDVKPVIASRGRPPNPDKNAKSTKPAPVSATTTKPMPRKRGAPASFKKPVVKKPVPGTRVAKSNTPDTNNTVPTVSAAKPPAVTAPVASIAPVTGITIIHPARRSVGKQTGQLQLARPITSGVPLSVKPPPTGRPVLLPLAPEGMVTEPHEAPTNLEEVLEPLTTSFNAQLNTHATHSTNLRDMLLNLSPRLLKLDDRCNTLRADVDNLESEVTSRAEMHKVLNGAFAKHMDELNRSQNALLERLQTDLRRFLVDEMRAVEKHLAEEIRTKSAEVFKELFRSVSESMKDTAVKNAIEDMSIPTCQSKSNVKRRGGRS